MTNKFTTGAGIAYRAEEKGAKVETAHNQFGARHTISTDKGSVTISDRPLAPHEVRGTLVLLRMIGIVIVLVLVVACLIVAGTAL